ncbi:MAG: glycosyl transferase group 1 [Gemmatimonadetes bacterium]|nr:glycosyl transferase group 1 [Gemmatimonadota bacterium]
MRVLVYRMNCGFNGVTTWMADLGGELKARGVDMSFWFVGGSPDRAAPFEKIGPTTIGPVASLLAKLDRERYDVVQIATGDRWSLALTLLPEKYKLVATNHGSVGRVWNSSNCHALIGVSRDIVTLEQPYTDLAVDLIYTGVDIKRFALPTSFESGAPIVAWVGRASDVKQKDFARFTRVAAALKAKGFRIWVADGSGASAAEFTGPDCAQVAYDQWKRLTMAEIPAFYQAVAASGGVVLMTSRYEAFGLVAIEAAAAGAATIGTDVLGLREAILPEYGTTFSATATDAEITTLVEDWIAANPPSLANCARRADAVAARFSLSQMADAYLSAYERAAPRLVAKPTVLPEELPSGAREWIRDAASPEFRHRSLWQPMARELATASEGRLALRALKTAVRQDPGAIARPRDAMNLMGTAVRALRGLVRG